MTTIIQVTKSKLRQRLLAYFFTNTDANLYLRQMSGILKEDPGNLSKELAGLVKEGIFISFLEGRQKYFSLNKKYALYKELKSIIFKTIGVEGSIRKIIQGLDNVSLSFVYGSFAEKRENAASDIDLIIIGKPNEDDLLRKIDELEKKLRREINYTVYPELEFKTKLKRKDFFILNILKRPKIILKGSLDEL